MESNNNHGNGSSLIVIVATLLILAAGGGAGLAFGPGPGLFAGGAIFVILILVALLGRQQENTRDIAIEAIRAVSQQPRQVQDNPTGFSLPPLSPGATPFYSQLVEASTPNSVLNPGRMLADAGFEFERTTETVEATPEQLARLEAQGGRWITPELFRTPRGKLCRVVVLEPVVSRPQTQTYEGQVLTRKEARAEQKKPGGVTIECSRVQFEENVVRAGAKILSRNEFSALVERPDNLPPLYFKFTD